MTSTSPPPQSSRAVGDWTLQPGRWVPLAAGGKVYVREVDTAVATTPVVLLHGIATTGGLMWFATMSQLGEHYRVLVPDLRGHGRSASQGRFRLDDAADDVVGMLDALDIDRAVVFGYSLGGTIAQLVAHRHPERLRGLVLAATAARLGPRGAARVPMIAASRVTSAVSALPLRKAWFRPLADEADAAGGAWAWFAAEMRGCHPQTILQAGAELERFDARPWLPTLHVPTAVIVTKRDRVVPPAAQRQLGTLIPGAHTIEIDAGHVAPGMAAEIFGPAAVQACKAVTRRATAKRSAPRNPGRANLGSRSPA